MQDDHAAVGRIEPLAQPVHGFLRRTVAPILGRNVVARDDEAELLGCIDELGRSGIVGKSEHPYGRLEIYVDGLFDRRVTLLDVVMIFFVRKYRTVTMVDSL